MSIEELADLRTPWCVHVAATLGVAELIQNGVHSAGDLAQRVRCDKRTLELILRHLVSRGVFVETAPGEFDLNDAAHELIEARAFLNLDGIGGLMARAWSTLPDVVRTGKPTRSFWSDLDENPVARDTFDDLIGPGGHSDFDGDFDLSDGWGSVRRVIDVGGGTGSMLAAILKQHGHVSGTLVDVPRTVSKARAVFERAEVLDRADVIGQSFFDPLPSGGDVYLLRGVINDWPDDEAVAILSRCAEAAAPKGRVVVMKSVVEAGVKASLEIEYVLCGGYARTLEEFQQLAGRAGLDIAAMHRTSAGRFYVECVPRVIG